jgi:hypothetical protein
MDFDAEGSFLDNSLAADRMGNGNYIAGTATEL